MSSNIIVSSRYVNKFELLLVVEAYPISLPSTSLAVLQQVEFALLLAYYPCIGGSFIDVCKRPVSCGLLKEQR